MGEEGRRERMERRMGQERRGRMEVWEDGGIAPHCWVYVSYTTTNRKATSGKELAIVN